MGGFLVIVGTLALLAGGLALVVGLLLSLLRRPVRKWMRWKPALGLAVLGLVIGSVGTSMLPPVEQTAETPQQEITPAVAPAPQPEAVAEEPTPLDEMPVEAEEPEEQAQGSQDLAEQATAPAAAPWIKVSASPTGPFTVNVDVTTNLPDEALLSSSLSLADQAPNDTFIGTSFEKFNIKEGKASFVIDGTKRVMPMNSTLPAGTYDVEVDFHPLWSENRALAGELDVTETVTGLAQVELGGSGESAGSAQAKAELRKSTMLNVNMGDEWDAAYYTEKLGSYEELPLEGGNPEVLKVYYFPKVDMTFIVNVLKGEISVWRDGKANR